MDKKKSSKTKLSRNKNRTEAKVKIITISDDLNETCEFRKSERILSKPSSEKAVKKSEEKRKEKISKKSFKSDSLSQAENSRCPACLSITQDMQRHLQTCLKAKFGRNDLHKKEEITANDGSTVDGLNKGVSLNGSENLGEEATEKIEQNPDKKLLDDSPLDLDVDFCHICQKDISRLNSQRKSQHVNNCIDQGEEKQKQLDEEKRVLESAKTAVLDCPMCGKPFKTESGRKNHLKKCAQSLGVKTEQMLKLVKEQEEEHQLKLAAGILPINSRKQTKKSSSVTSAGSKKRIVKEPKNKLDEDTQIAMAISSSLTEEQNKQERPVTGMLGVSSTVKAAGDTKKGKKKKVQDDQPVLLMLPDDEKQKRLENKIMSVLLPQDEDEEIENTPPSLQKSVLQEKYHMESNNAPGLWQRSQLLEIDMDKLKKKEIFYVQTLMPPVEESKVLAGSKVRQMSEIPGRRKSVRVTDDIPEQTHSEKADESQSVDVMMVSTQTAVVLAELATVEEEHEDISDSLSCSGFCPEKYIKIEEPVQDQLTKELKNSLLNLLENPTSSDLEIISLDGRHDVHKTIITCRCPELCLMAEGSLVHLEEFSSDVVSSVLMYIYAGEITLTPTMLESALELAERLKLKELIEVYKQIKSQLAMETEDQQTVDNKVPGSHLERQSSDIDSLLKEIMDDSDEDLETKTDHMDTETDRLNTDIDDLTSKRDSEKQIDGEISGEDYYDIMCSQRQKLQKAAKDDHCNVNFQEGSGIDFDEEENCNAVISKVCDEENKEMDCMDEDRNQTGMYDDCVKSEKGNYLDKKYDNKIDNLGLSDKDYKGDNLGLTDNNNDNSDKIISDKDEIKMEVDEFENLTPRSRGNQRKNIDLDFDKNGSDFKRIHDGGSNEKDYVTDCLDKDNQPSGISTSQKRNSEDLKSNKNQILKRSKTIGRRKTRQNCVSPDVFSDVRDTSLVYENDEFVVLSQSESDDSFKHSFNQDGDKSSKLSNDTDIKSLDDLDPRQNLSCDDKHEIDDMTASQSPSRNVKKHGSQLCDDENDNQGACVEKKKVNESLSEHAVIICSDDSCDSISIKNTDPITFIGDSSSVKLDEKNESSYYGNRNILESTRINPCFNIKDKNSHRLDELSMVKPQLNNISLKMSSPTQSPENRIFSHGNSVSESLDGTLNRRLDSSSTDLFASPPENIARTKIPPRLSNSSDSVSQYSPANYNPNKSHESVSENDLSNSKENGNIMSDITPENDQLGYGEKLCNIKETHDTNRGLNSAEATSVIQVLPVDDKIKTADDGFSSDESESSSVYLKHHKKKISGKGFTLSLKSPDYHVKDRKRKKFDKEKSSDEESDSGNRNLSFKKTKLNHSIGVAENCLDAVEGLSDRNANSPHSPRLGCNYSPDTKFSTSRNRSLNRVYRNSVNKQKGNELVEITDIENKMECQTEDDVEILGDNFEELSQGRSPIFKVKEKKKFLFKKRKELALEKKTECVIEEEGKIQNEDEDSDSSPAHKRGTIEENLNTGYQSEGDQMDDVWEGFDDDCGVVFGGTCDINTPVLCDMDSTVSHNTSQTKSKADNVEDRKKSLYEDGDRNFEECLIDEQDDGDLEKHVDEADVTEFGNDSFMWKDDNAPLECEDDITEEAEKVISENLQNRNKSKEDFKTPSVGRSHAVVKKTWIPPSPFTPMPDYEKMATPVLKKEVQKYGVKPVGKKRNIMLLKDIYKQTHQYETDSDCDDDDVEHTDDRLSGKTDQHNMMKSASGTCSKAGVKIGDKSGKTAAIGPGVVMEDDGLSSSDDTNCSQDSDKSDMVEESFLQVREDEDDIPQSQMTSGTELNKKILDFLHTRPDIKVRMLMYEPLELDWLKKEIKDSGIKCSMDKVMEFLDEKCITFTMKNRRQEKANKKGRGRGKKKADVDHQGKT